jgi:hypothetical protein
MVRPFYRRSTLTPEEQELKNVMQAILIKIGVLKTDSEAEWSDFATRRALRGFPELMQHLTQRAKEAQAPAAVGRKDAAPRKPARTKPKGAEKPRGRR